MDGKNQVKTETNRRNALKSTGPRTARGKEIVRRNAMKHGLLSREVVIDAGEGKENAAEFKQLLAQLQIDLCPVGIVEEMLVEKIAVSYWRLRRALRCEVGLIRSRLDSISWKTAFRLMDQFNAARKSMLLDESTESLSRTSFGTRFIIGFLDEVKNEFEAVGTLSDETIARVFGRFGHESNDFGFTLLLFYNLAIGKLKPDEADTNSSDKIPDPGRCKRAFVELIDEKIDFYKEMQKTWDQLEDLEGEATQLSLSLPQAEAADKLLRYETSIEKQFYRALHELMRIQSARRGEKPPAPLAIDVDISRES